MSSRVQAGNRKSPRVFIEGIDWGELVLQVMDETEKSARGQGDNWKISSSFDVTTHPWFGGTRKGGGEFSDARGRGAQTQRWPLLSAQPRTEKREEMTGEPSCPRAGKDDGRNGAEVIQARTVLRK